MAEEQEIIIPLKKRKKIGVIIGIIIVIILSVAAVVVFATVGSSKSRAVKQIELGEKYLDELEYEQAIVAFKEAIKINPKSADAYIGLAKAYTKLGDLDKAKEVLDDAKKKVTDKDGKDAIDRAIKRLQNQMNPTPELSPSPVTTPDAEVTGTTTPPVDEPTPSIEVQPGPGDNPSPQPTATESPVPTMEGNPTPTMGENPNPTVIVDPNPTEGGEPSAAPTGEVQPGPENTNTPIPTPAPLENVEVTQLNIDLSKYSSFSNMRAGVILVQSKENGAWGAIDYNGKELVPCNYAGDGWQSATDTGYFMLCNSDDETFVFDKNGNLIVSSYYISHLFDYYYIEYYELEGSDVSHIDYYSYDGKLVLATTGGDYALGGDNDVLTVYDERSFEDCDLSAEAGRIKAELLAKGYINNNMQVEIVPAEPRRRYIGYLDKYGQVTWNLYYEGASVAEVRIAEMTTNPDGVTTYSYVYTPQGAYKPLSGSNNGYCTMEDAYSTSGNTDLNLYICDDKGQLINATANMQNFDKWKEYNYFFHNDAFFYNNGNRMSVTYTNEKTGQLEYALIDCKTGKIIGTYDYLAFDGTNTALVRQGQYYYHCNINDGSMFEYYDSATLFTGHYAGVVIDGEAAIINDKMYVEKYLGPATGVTLEGDVLRFKTAEGYKYYSVKEK